jgi:hypothetical protein
MARVHHFVVIASVLVLLGAQHPSFGQPTESYTVEEVFAGLLFGAGRAAELFPDLWPARQTIPTPKTPVTAAIWLDEGARALRREKLVTEADTTKLSTIARGIAEGRGTTRERVTPEQVANFAFRRIAERDPDFVARFRSEISSGDQLRVQAVVAESSRRVNEILLGTISVDQPFRSGIADDIAVNVNTLVNVDTAINVNVAYNVDTVKNITNAWVDRPLDERSRLVNEVIINAITIRLGTIQFR